MNEFNYSTMDVLSIDIYLYVMEMVGFFIENLDRLDFVERYNGVRTLLYCDLLSGEGQYYAANLYDITRQTCMTTIGLHLWQQGLKD